MTFTLGASLDVAGAIRAAARPMASHEDVSPALEVVGDAEVVLIGEATHGTHEFYAFRARLTRALIEERGFAAVAIEGDWPDADRINRYVRQDGADPDERAAFAGFARFPTWMWRNTAVAEFVAWLHGHNAALAPDERVGFHGLDLYSLHASMRAVVDYLSKHDHEAAQAARHSYACFDHHDRDPRLYGWAVARLGSESCQEAVTRELVALRARRDELLRRDGRRADEAFFSAEQNARLARNAEIYYRAVVTNPVAAWNIRDRHMAGTLEELRQHLERRERKPRVVVWAHNSHLGDAQATDAAKRGEVNLGQLVREQHGRAARLIGQTTHAGSVMAAANWEEPGSRQGVRPALLSSWEDLFHQTGVPRFLLPLGGSTAPAWAQLSRLQRAIGIVYRSNVELRSHYQHARLADQFDAVVHFDETTAVVPLEAPAAWHGPEEAETFPSGV